MDLNKENELELTPDLFEPLDESERMLKKFLMKVRHIFRMHG